MKSVELAQGPSKVGSFFSAPFLPEREGRHKYQYRRGCFLKYLDVLPEHILVDLKTLAIVEKTTAVSIALENDRLLDCANSVLFAGIPGSSGRSLGYPRRPPGQAAVTGAVVSSLAPGSKYAITITHHCKYYETALFSLQEPLSEE